MRTGTRARWSACGSARRRFNAAGPMRTGTLGVDAINYRGANLLQ